MSDRAELIRNALAFLTDPNVTPYVPPGPELNLMPSSLFLRRGTILSRSVWRF